MRSMKLVSALCAAVVATVDVPAFAQDILAPLVRRPHYSEEGVDRWWTVIDSRWGFVTRFNLALADSLDGCAGVDASRQAAIIRLAPNRFGSVAEEGLQILGSCDAKKIGDWRPGQPVTVGLWRRVAPDQPLPTTIEKSRALNFRGAGIATDYDVAYWTADAPLEAAEPLREVFVWGPSRASVVDGCYVQRIIRTMANSSAGRSALEQSFNRLPDALASLRTRKCPADLGTFQNDADKQAFRNAIMRVGATIAGREAYDAAYLGTGGPWAVKLARLYRIYQAADLKPTETDFAMFLELARGTPLPESRVEALTRALRQAAPASPAQARRALAHLLAPVTEAVRDYELGRSVSYYIDEIGQESLSFEELASWQRHGRVKASDVGLTESPYLPCDLVQELSDCTRTVGQQ
jgi:hypothetical protein